MVKKIAFLQRVSEIDKSFLPVPTVTEFQT